MLISKLLKLSLLPLAATSLVFPISCSKGTPANSSNDKPNTPVVPDDNGGNDSDKPNKIENNKAVNQSIFLKNDVDIKISSYYIEFTKWMEQNRINPYILPQQETLNYFIQSYSSYKQTNPTSSLQDFLDFKEQNISWAKNTFVVKASYANMYGDTAYTLDEKSNIKNAEHVFKAINSNLSWTNQTYSVPDEDIDAYFSLLLKDKPQAITSLVSYFDKLISKQKDNNLKNIFTSWRNIIEKETLFSFDKNIVYNEIENFFSAFFPKSDYINSILNQEQLKNLKVLISPTSSTISGIVDQYLPSLVDLLKNNVPSAASIIAALGNLIQKAVSYNLSDKYQAIFVVDAVAALIKSFVPEYAEPIFVTQDMLDLIILNDNNVDKTNKLMVPWLQYINTLIDSESELHSTINLLVIYILYFDKTIPQQIIQSIYDYLSSEADKIVNGEFLKLLEFRVLKIALSYLAGSCDGSYINQCGSDADYGYRLSKDPSYSPTANWSEVSEGDIMYEASGFNYVVGHVAMIDGVFYDIAHNKFYVKTIDAVNPSIYPSLLDQNRVEDNECHLLHVKGATKDQKQAAANFDISQIGHKYEIKLTETPDLEKVKSNTESWYCSELVNYSYHTQGIDLINYDFANQFRKGDIASTITYILGLLDGSISYTQLPKDCDLIDILGMAVGAVTPREVDASNKLTQYI